MGKHWIGGGQRVWFDDEYIHFNDTFTLNFTNDRKEGAWFNDGAYEICCDLTLTDVREMITYLTSIEKEMCKKDK